MVTHYQRLLEAAVADPQRPVGSLELLTNTERAQILQEWNRTEAEYPADKCVHELFEQQVQRTPDAAAVVYQ